MAARRDPRVLPLDIDRTAMPLPEEITRLTLRLDPQQFPLVDPLAR